MHSHTEYKILLGIRMNVTEFKSLGTVLCQRESMEGEIREGAVKGRQVIGALQSHEREWCESGGKEGY